MPGIGASRPLPRVPTTVEDPTIDGDALVINKFQMRGRFAMRLADYKDGEGGTARAG
jgi:hypothetical protein